MDADMAGVVAGAAAGNAQCTFYRVLASGDTEGRET